MPAFPLRPTVLAGAIALLTLPCVSLAQAPAAAAEAARAFAIDAGPLADTLSRIARESGKGLAADPALVRDRRAPAVQGRFTPEQAARRALAGSGLELVVTATGGWSLRAAPAQVAPSSVASPSLAAVTVTAAAELPAYMADRPTTIATKTDLLPRLTPFSVDQVTEELMQERGDANIYATLESFAGLTTNSSNSDAGGGHSRAIQIRGFSNGQTLINGIPSYSDTAGTIRGTDSLEAVELLRGPAGLYYGSAEPGGVISYNYKRPKNKAAYVLRADVDSKGSYGGMVDATGPLNADATLMYRLVGSHKHRKDDQDHIWSEPKSVMAALTYKPGREFETTLTYERMDMESVPEQENNFRITSGALAGQYYPVPKEFFWGSLNDRVVRETETLIWDATWSESEALKIRAGLNIQQYTQWWQNTRARNPANGPNAAGLVQRYVSGRQSEGDSFAGSLDFSGVLRAGAWRHDWLVGGGYGHSEGASSGRQVANQSISNTGIYPVTPINVYNPVHGDYAYSDRIWADPLVPSAERTDKNLYLQDIVHLPGGRTRLMVGAGWSEYLSEPRTGAATKVDKWTPRLAAMRDLDDTTTVYASYGESFVPQGSLTYLNTSGQYITDPVEGLQYEIGLKKDLFGGSALFTAALFRVDKKNVASVIDGFECAPGAPAVPSLTPADACYQLAGLTRAQGLELRLSGQIRDGWVAQIGYSYTGTEYVNTENEFARGRSVEYTPRHNLAVWNKFRLHRSESVGEVNLGVGLKVWSEAHGTWSAAGANRNPGYGLVDMGLFWDKALSGGKQLKVSFNISNLFDKQFYERRRFPPGTVLYGDERRASLSAQLSF
jgi:iron complex outermembrane receptor protein